MQELVGGDSYIHRSIICIDTGELVLDVLDSTSASKSNTLEVPQVPAEVPIECLDTLIHTYRRFTKQLSIKWCSVSQACLVEHGYLTDPSVPS